MLTLTSQVRGNRIGDGPMPRCACQCHKWLTTPAVRLTGTSLPISLKFTSAGPLCGFCIDELNQPWNQVLDETLRIAATGSEDR